MPDVFISYSIQDESLAKFVCRYLENERLDVFLASVSLDPGEKWSSQIMEKLRATPWIVFLASRVACQSPFVLQELGAAIFSKKEIVPIVWDISPDELPGWISQYQALNLAGASLETIPNEVKEIAKRIKGDKLRGLLIAGAVIAGLLYFCSKG